MSPFGVTEGGVAPFRDARRAGGVKDDETRGETAERAVAPLAMDEGGWVDDTEDERREAGGAARVDAVVAIPDDEGGKEFGRS